MRFKFEIVIGCLLSDILGFTFPVMIPIVDFAKKQ